MSGVEIIGLISGIITLIDAAIKIYKLADDTTGLPASFQDATSRLPAIHDTLELASQGVRTDAASSPSDDGLKILLQACARRAAALRDILQVTFPQTRMSKTGKYLSALKIIQNAKKLDELTLGIIHDLQVLTAHQIVQSTARAQMTESLINLANRGRRQESLKACTVSLQNFGSGSQFSHTGVGNQNIVVTGATQINGNITGGTFNVFQT
jgi:hypothetical protein